MKRVDDRDRESDIIEESEDMRTRVLLVRDDAGEWWAVVRTDGSGRGYMYNETAWHINPFDDPSAIDVAEAALEAAAVFA